MSKYKFGSFVKIVKPGFYEGCHGWCMDYIPEHEKTYKEVTTIVPARYLIKLEALNNPQYYLFEIDLSES